MPASLSLQTLPTTLRHSLQNPSIVSGLASLGVHGLLFFLVMPTLSFAAWKADEPEVPSSVPLVELTPEEQQRLPDLATAPIELPPVAQEPDLFTLTPVPSTPPAPEAPKPAAPPALPNLSFFAPPPMPLFIPSVPAPRPIPSPSRQATAPSPAPSPRPSASPSPQASPTPALPNVSPAPTQPVTEASPQPSASPGETAVQPSPESSPAPRSPEQVTQDLIARQEELREQFAFNPSGTKPEEANVSFGRWFYEELNRQDSDQYKQTELVLPYPREACLVRRRPEQEQQDIRVVYGVEVDPEGKLVDEPRLLQSSGYRFFNEQALTAIQSGEFETSDANQAYLVGVRFRYNPDRCPAASPSPPPAS